jgi:predicted transcriptional regulator
MPIDTDVDRLFSIIKEKKKISLRSASKKLGEKKETIESWAKTLDEAGLIDFDYSLNPIAGAYMKVKKVERKKEKDKKTK